MPFKFSGCSLLGQNVQFLLSEFTTGVGIFFFRQMVNSLSGISGLLGIYLRMRKIFYIVPWNAMS